MKNIFVLISGLFLSLSLICARNYPLEHVDPFIGTQDEGHCYPGASMPMGMAQPSPETSALYTKGYEGRHVAGYQYRDPWITGFTQTHLNGVGCPSMSDILVQPFCSKNIDDNEFESFRSSYDKKSETAKPGYYSVYLKDNHVDVELTASYHSAIYRFTYDNPSDAKILLDLQYGVKWNIDDVKKNIIESEQEIQDEFTIKGYRLAREWTDRKLYYVIKFNKPICSYRKLAPYSSEEKASRFVLDFNLSENAALLMKIGLSTVSIEGAEANLAHEISGFDFDVTLNRAESAWNDILTLFEIKGSDTDKTAFYTALYHLYLQPNNIADIDGRYRGEDDMVHISETGKHYSTFSLWDTYRAAHPFYTIVTPDHVNDFIISMMQCYDNKPVNPLDPKEANPYLPRWGLWGREVHTMIGNHAVPVIVDAYLKNIREWGKYTDDDVFDAIWTSVALPHYRNHVGLIDEFGYIPIDIKQSPIDDGRETVSRLLEGIYDDYCASVMADSLGRYPERDHLKKRAGYYRNVYDSRSGFMRGRKADGTFRENVNPCEVVGEWMESSDFTEGSAWHYTFHVQHDVQGMIGLMGGKRSFSYKLDTLFSLKREISDDVMNLKGYIGQYSHGNEPSHHVAYLYKYTDHGYKTDSLVREITSSFYPTTPDGLIGNDDCGQMSAWYLFSVMGFYPVDPCGGNYILGAPQLPFVRIKLPDGKLFTIKAENLYESHKYVKSVSLDGRTLDRNYITHDEISRGGTLVFKMSDKHN